MARRLVLFCAALVLALFGTGAVWAYAHGADARAVAGQRPAQVLVATAAVKAGATTDALAGATAPTLLASRTVPLGALTDLAGERGKVLDTDLYPGQVIVPAMFRDPADAAVVEPLPIPAGKVAVSVALGDPMRVAGFVRPGAEVAVFTTYNADAALGRGGSTTGELVGPSVTTRLVLPRALVLAVATTPLAGAHAPAATPQGGTAAQAGDTTSVTLALGQADAEKLIQVAQAGHPYLALLSPSSTTAATGGTDNRTLLG